METKLKNDEMRRRAVERGALPTTALDTAASQDLTDLLQVIVERAARLLGALGGALYVCEPDTRLVRRAASYNSPIDHTDTVLHYGQGIAGSVAQTGEPSIFEDYRSWPGRDATSQDESPPYAVLSAPLLWENQVTGVIYLVDSAQDRRFTPADLELLTVFADQAAMTLENTRLHEQAQAEIAERRRAEQTLLQRNQELALLNRLGQELTATLDLGQIAERLLPTITATIGCEGASIWLWEEEKGDELICRAMTFGTSLRTVDLSLKPEQGIAGWVIRNGRHAIVEDVRDDPRFYPGIDELLGFRTTSLIAVPIEARGKVIGVLEAVNKLHEGFGADDLKRVTMLAASAGIAIDNAQLFETLQRRNRELHLINQTGQALSSILNLDQVLTASLEEVCRLLEVTASSLWLRDPETDELVCRQATGPHREVVRGWRLSPGQGIIGWVAQSGESLIVPDTKIDTRHFKGVDEQTGLYIRSILAVPLTLKEDVIGVLQMVDENVNRFKPGDLLLLESLAATAAIAIENAHLYAQAQQDNQAKSILLHEINHRVKNNLSAIIGILYAERQHAEIQDQAVYRSIVQDLINWVQGLATAHRLLSSHEWAPVRLSDLTARVIRSSLQALPRDKHVSVEIDPSPVLVTPDQAHHLALVINELTTNTVKHTLGERDAAHISVSIGLDDDTIQCEFRDDGPGYPNAVLRLEQHNVGFDLIQSIVNEGLRGELALRSEEGAVTTLRFKAQVTPN